MNIVMTEQGKFVEIQGTAEGEPFTKDEMNNIIQLAEQGIAKNNSYSKRCSEIIHIMQKIILSTNNEKKLSEIETLLHDLPIQTIAQSKLNIGQAEEPLWNIHRKCANQSKICFKSI